MKEKKLQLRIITPENIKTFEDADMIVMRCTTGDLGILPGHDEYSALLDDGVVRLIYGNNEKRLFVYSGIATVRRDLITVITGEAEWLDDLDVARANTDLEHARQRQLVRDNYAVMQSDQASLRRALVPIEVSTTTIKDQE